MEEIYNKRSKWQDVSVDIKILSPIVCLPLPEAIYMYKSMKKKLVFHGRSHFVPESLRSI